MTDFSVYAQSLRMNVVQEQAVYAQLYARQRSAADLYADREQAFYHAMLEGKNLVRLAHIVERSIYQTASA